MTVTVAGMFVRKFFENILEQTKIVGKRLGHSLLAQECWYWGWRFGGCWI